MRKTEEDFESRIFFEAQKDYFGFELRFIFFQMVIFTTLFRRCPMLWKLTLKMTTLFRRGLALFNSTLKYTTLSNVVNFNFDVHNVVSTLTWHCATSRRHINLNTTLNQRWNVRWERSFYEQPWRGLKRRVSDPQSVVDTFSKHLILRCGVSLEALGLTHIVKNRAKISIESLQSLKGNE